MGKQGRRSGCKDDGNSAFSVCASRVGMYQQNWPPEPFAEHFYIGPYLLLHSHAAGDRRGEEGDGETGIRVKGTNTRLRAVSWASVSLYYTDGNFFLFYFRVSTSPLCTQISEYVKEGNDDNEHGNEGEARNRH